MIRGLTLAALLFVASPATAQITDSTVVSGTGTTITSGTGTTRVQVPIWFLGIGDSKTAGDDWLPMLTQTAAALAIGPHAAVDRGVPGATVATTTTNLAVVLAVPYRATAPIVLMNFGANDVVALPAEATWTANYLVLIDAVRAIWPTAPIYLARPWRRSYLTECNTLATWIAAIAALRTNVFVGMDERVWMQAADDGAVMSSDGVHYSIPAGQYAALAAWIPVIWP